MSSPVSAAWLADAGPGLADLTPGQARWSVRLLGTLEAHRGGRHLARWPSRAVGALLARLALAPQRAHAREELIELLWPGVALDVGRNRLRQALSTLKSLLEPPGSLHTPVIVADRSVIRVAAGALVSDAIEFERLLRNGDAALAASLYRGELMPGFYDEWVLEERARLAALSERCLAAAAAVSPPRSAGGRAHPAPAAIALPTYLTRPYGIEAQAARLAAMAQRERLLTVHGAGGSGKTRLAIEAARANADRSVDGRGAMVFDRVVFVALAPCITAAQVLDAIRQALAIEGAGAGHQPQVRITALLEGQRVLLVLDNAEQIDAEAGAAAAGLLAALPGLHLLVTSRRRLGIDGEVIFSIDALPVPPPAAGPEELAGSAAVALFVDRVCAARADFVLGPHNAAAVAKLLRLLGGMPLAIELAASRVRSMSPAELAERLCAGEGTPMLDLLARGGARAAADARHASMRQVIEWSWRLLGPAAQDLLQALSIFAAPVAPPLLGFVAAMEAKALQEGLDELADASLVTAVTAADGAVRYALQEPVREFAVEQASAGQARARRQRLRQWLLDRANPAARGGVAAATAELSHVHAAITSAVADGAGRDAARLAVALRLHWESDTLPAPDVEALEAMLSAVADPGLEADLRELLAAAHLSAGNGARALAHADAALALPLDPGRRSRVLSRWAAVRYGTGTHDAAVENALAQALELACAGGDRVAEATVLRFQGVMACNIHLDYARCEALVGRAQRIWEQLGYRRLAWARLRDRATMWAWMGRNSDAAVVLQAVEAAATADADWHGTMVTTRQLGRVYVRMRRWADAAAALRRSIGLAWQRQNALELGVALLHLPDALVMAGAVDTAARLQGFAHANWARLYGTLNRIELREVRRTRLLLHLRLGAARAEVLRLEGAAMSTAAAVALAAG
jgi:predicted ATPase